MNGAREKLAQMALKTTVIRDEPGELRVRFTLFRLIPRDLTRYLHYIVNVFEMLPAVKTCELDEKTGEAHIVYDASAADGGLLLRWLPAAADACLAAVRENPQIERMPEEAVVRLAKERLSAAARGFS